MAQARFAAVFALALGGLAAQDTQVITLPAPPGGAAAVEFRTQVPGSYALVDHALIRVERGLVGTLIVGGPKNFFSAGGAALAALNLRLGRWA